MSGLWLRPRRRDPIVVNFQMYLLYFHKNTFFYRICDLMIFWYQ